MIKDYLNEQDFNDILDAHAHELELNFVERYGVPEPGEGTEEQRAFMAGEIIRLVLDEGYTLMALTVMLCRYQILMGEKMAEHKAKREAFMRMITGQVADNDATIFIVNEDPNPFQP